MTSSLSTEEPSPDTPFQFRISTLLLIMALLSVPLACTGFCIRFKSGLISEYQADQIAEGMTRQEVIAILGEPHWRDPQDDFQYNCDFPTWHSDPLCIGFDDQGKVDWISR